MNGLMLIAGLGLLVAGAELLIRGGAALARRLGLTPLVIGLTVVAAGTSAPEMVVSVAGAVKGQGDIALGNVVGSNIFNIGVILALAAIISPVNVRLGLLKLDAPLMILVSLAAVGLAAFDTIPRWGGIVLLTSMIGYTAFSIRIARKQTDAEVDREFDDGVPKPLGSGWVEVLLVLGGLALLILGSRLLVTSTLALARALGVDEAIIGLTIVAAGTSMPEFATSAVAAVRGQSDIAVGNVIGSNLFNILGILGLATTLKPLHAPGIAAFDLWVMVAFAIGALPLLWTGRRLQRWEGALLFAAYLAYLWARWPA